ncbi:hypothetical protein [Mesorhizobium sp.]|uniref:hypothetical protein n=1 Tax=Mesorhizobium sp. TaxID=1871066 RepID=UPI000FE35D7D|nr:hypothetical protein [Mesorhizobium sp.]RWA67387.1 MAG: hypothetical protein EOQ28_27195 [Mesorhizobium sp.]RWB96607.1 MAG: hypothetical protein EOQ57_26545 [Mesorhizobium sp.]RWG79167.1 MAG: hypothetical protein EOQ69_24415 [Mesorhizobium sp.]RWG82053.1 MAG: hypothetical protein EOQ70_24115 [Mesorhizobium sp.]RWK06303.1 MAG: hypothetical protein EOR39_24895 [Mesorhizobium sp.]
MEQAVIVYLILRGGQFGAPHERQSVQVLEDRLQQVVSYAGVGEFDGDQFGEGKCTLYLYGPDAEKLFLVIEPVLRSAPVAAGGYAIKRLGAAVDLDAKEVRVSW